MLVWFLTIWGFSQEFWTLFKILFSNQPLSSSGLKLAVFEFLYSFFSKLWILWLLSWTDLSIVWRKPNDAPPTVVAFSRIIFIVFTIAWTRKRAVFTSFVKFKKERDSWRFRRTCSCSGKKRRMLSSFWWSFPGALLLFGSFLRKDCGCVFFRFLFTFLAFLTIE